MKANFSGFHPKPWKDSVDLPEPEPSQEELDNIMSLLITRIKGDYINHKAVEQAQAAINSLTLKQVLSLIDRMSDTPMPRVGKSDKYVRSPQSFQDGYAEARAELRQSAERIWKI